MDILVVEDALAMRKMIRRMLEDLGHRVAEAADGQEAWKHLQAEPVDLLLTDWNMPVMNGLRLVERVREAPALRDLPVIMSTTRNNKQDVIAAVKAGITNYITKPFKPSQLKARIDHALEQARQHSARQLAPVVDGARRPGLTDEDPLVVFVEADASLEGLSDPSQRAVAHYLLRATQVLRRLSDEHDELELAYALEDQPQLVMKLLRLHRRHLKLMLIGAAVGGGGVTLARLARLQYDTGLAVALVCRDADAFSASERDSIDRLGIFVVERGHMDADFLEQFFEEHVVAQAHAFPESPIPPERVSERLETDMRLMTRLPSMPRVPQRIAELARDQDSTLEQWSHVIRTDPVCSASVIRYARSPVYGFQLEVADVRKAVTLLGKDVVKRLIFSSTIRGDLLGPQRGLPLDDYWNHSMSVGLVARMLSFPWRAASDLEDCERRELASWHLTQTTTRRLHRLDLAARLGLGEDHDPFLGGLLHDIGKLALALAYPGLIEAVEQELSQADWRLPAHLVEERLTGCATHTGAGRILACSWDLGDDMVHAIGAHHDPGDDAYARLIHLADFVGGAMRPLPRRAGFPHVRAVAPGVDEADTGALEGEALRAACEPFVSTPVLADLDLDVETFLDLALDLAPAVERLTTGLRQSIEAAASDADGEAAVGQAAVLA